MSAARPLPPDSDADRWLRCWLCGGTAPRTPAALSGYRLATWWPQVADRKGLWLPLSYYAQGSPHFLGVACSPLCCEMAQVLIAGASRLMEG